MCQLLGILEELPEKHKVFGAKDISCIHLNWHRISLTSVPKYQLGALTLAVATYLYTFGLSPGERKTKQISFIY